MSTSIPISPAFRQIMLQNIANDVDFKHKKEMLNMMYCEQLLLEKCDPILLMKIHYYVTHTDSPLKIRCLELLQAHFKRHKFKIRKVNMDTIQKEIQLNLSIAKEQREELLNMKEEVIDKDDTLSDVSSEKPVELFDPDMDIAALEQLKSELEKQVLIQMKGMGSELKSSSLRFGQVLQNDSSTILDTHTLMTTNESNLSVEQKKLKQVHSDTWRTTCYMLMLFLLVLVCFIATYMVIRTFPDSNAPKLTSFVGNAIYSLWQIAFPSDEPQIVPVITITNEEL